TSLHRRTRSRRNPHYRVADRRSRASTRAPPIFSPTTVRSASVRQIVALTDPQPLPVPRATNTTDSNTAGYRYMGLPASAHRDSHCQAVHRTWARSSGDVAQTSWRGASGVEVGNSSHRALSALGMILDNFIVVRVIGLVDGAEHNAAFLSVSVLATAPFAGQLDRAASVAGNIAHAVHAH